MTVVHLQRPTKINRVSLCSLNTLAARFPEAIEVHLEIYRVVSSRHKAAINLATLEELMLVTDSPHYKNAVYARQSSQT